MLIRFSIHATAQDYRRGLRQAFPKYRLLVWIMVVLLVAVGADFAAALVISADSHQPIGDLVAIEAVAMAGALFSIGQLTIGRVWRCRRLARTPREMEISENGVTGRTATTETHVHWSEYTSARETEDFFVLRRPRRTVLIPKANLDEIPAGVLRDFLFGGEFARLSSVRRRRAVRVAVVSPPRAPSTLPAPPRRPPE